MNKWFFFIFLILNNVSIGQSINIGDIGYRHLKFYTNSDSVDILIKFKKGDEKKCKPVFLFCQGSLPQPLIKLDGKDMYKIFPFALDSLEQNFHLVIISKPSIPLIVDSKNLGKDFVYIDSITNKIPLNYTKRNTLDYYVNRNIKVIDYLFKLNYIDKSKLVVAGHSEGSTIAAKLAYKCKKVTHLIYASGNPLGRIMSIIGRDRTFETNTDSTQYAEYDFEYWKNVVNNPESIEETEGDTYKSTFGFSLPSIRYLEKIKIPILVCYGTKDWSTPFNDYLRVEMIRQKNKNITFKSYVGLEHNFFPIDKLGKPIYDVYNWDKVALDWLKWIK